MAKFVSERNLSFMLYELFDVEELTQYPLYADHSKEIFDMVLQAGLKLSKEVLRPSFEDMDQNPPEFVDGKVTVHPQVIPIMKAFGDGGWIAASASYELGGQQLPLMLAGLCRYIFAAANYSAIAFPFLTSAGATFIEKFGNKEMIETYVPKMFSGEWQGTMVMTEPQAGSSISDLLTSAEPTDQGYYKIKGQKIFISCADYEGIENIVHVLLARVKGAPAGVKGLSLFLIPKKRIEAGELVPNDFQVTGIYHKMGYKAAPLTQLSLGDNDDCHGYLIGEENKGLQHMFVLMNEARIGVGVMATSTASAAYYASMEYTQERTQGRKVESKDPTTPMVPIIEHADVKRMLLFQRAVVDGSLSLIMQCSKYADLEHVLEGEEKEKASLLLDILTPIVKSYPSEMGIQSVSAGLQCLGGYGYCDEFPLELYLRDARIHPIHEGTTGIHGMDLLGRKVVMKKGKAFQLYIGEVQKVISEAENLDELKGLAQELKTALDNLQAVTLDLTKLAAGGKVEEFLADATLYLELFGIIAIAWQWLFQAVVAQKALNQGASGDEADFYTGKLFTCRYFFSYELPKIAGLLKRLQTADGLTIAMQTAYFND